MMIRNLHPGLEIAISADDCVLLARACRHAADVTQEDGDQQCSNRTDSYLFYLMACTLDAYALINDAGNRLMPSDREGWGIADIHKGWSPLVWDGRPE